MIDHYSIVKLMKSKYNPAHVTEADPSPRVLIIRGYVDSRQYLVKYPDGFIHRVNEEWITNKSIFSIDHPEYTRLARTMPVIEKEFRRNERFQSYLTLKQPAFATELQQHIEAKHQASNKYFKPPINTLSDIADIPALLPVPDVAEDTIVPDSVVMYLKSIDNKLNTLIQLWGGQGNE